MNNRSNSILMIFPIAPWPARENGISIRYYPVLAALSRKHKIDVFVHSEHRSGTPSDPILKTLRRVEIRHKAKTPPGITDRILTIAETLSPFGCPHRFARYHSGLVLEQLAAFVAGQRYDSILWVMHEYRHLLRYLAQRFSEAYTAYDGIDSPYLHYLREPPPGGLMNLYRTFELWKTRRWESNLVAGADATSYISAPDATASITSSTPNVRVIPNGIYLEGQELPNSPQPAGLSLGFLGNMAYLQNVQGALQLHDKVFAPLKRDLTDLRLVIIGRSPVAKIQALASRDVEVTGTVDSIWPYIARVDVFVYPMIGGAGLQNKILEAMHAGKPVVTTEICLRSIGAREGKEILIGRTDEELRSHTRALLMNPEYARELGSRGKAYVDRNFDMCRVLQRFEQFLVPGSTDLN